MKKLLILVACLFLMGCDNTQICRDHAKEVLIICMEANLSAKECLQKYHESEIKWKRNQ